MSQEMKNIVDAPRLAEDVRSAGWASKIKPGDLTDVLSGLTLQKNPNLSAGIEISDDAVLRCYDH